MLEPAFIPGLLAAISIFFALLCLARLKQRRLMAAARAGTGACIALAITAVVMAVALNLYTYHRLSHERQIATLFFNRTSPQHFSAVLQRPGLPDHQVALTGDEWQLDARILKWRPMANLLGFNALCRLDRLSGRYRDIDAENAHPPRAYPLVIHERGLSAWQAARRAPRWLGLVDARYGNAAYLPMADGARFQIFVSQSGLVARPANDAARAAISRWWD